ncbi:hypothetical protein CANCADRAFT_16854, partial [Tortispora caseinolytica NRRL Y-17796]
AAMYKLGIINLRGMNGETQNVVEGIQWLKRAASLADKENPHALHELGLLYEGAVNGNCDPAISNVLRGDPKLSFDYFAAAAKLDYSPAHFKLGSIYEYGLLGCPIDARLSLAWYSRGAQKRDPDCELALSGWYLTGAEGILQQSDKEAYLWARKAAEKGLSKAEYAMGYFSEVGIGAKESLDEARRWYYKAASQNHSKAIEKLQEL